MNSYRYLLSVILFFNTILTFCMGGIFSSFQYQESENIPEDPVTIDISNIENSVDVIESIKGYLQKCKNNDDLYDLGIKFQTCKGPVFINNKSKSLEVAKICFENIINQDDFRNQTSTQEKEILAKSYYRLGMIEYHSNNYEEAFFAFKKAWDFKNQESLNMLKRMKEDGLITKYFKLLAYVDNFLEETQDILLIYQLGLNFRDGQNPIIKSSGKANLVCFEMCFANILKKLEAVSTTYLNEKAIDLLGKYYHEIGMYFVKCKKISTAHQCFIRAVELGSEVSSVELSKISFS